MIETIVAEVDYRQRLTKTAFEEWVIPDKKPLILTPTQIVQLGFTPLALDQLGFRQWDLDPNDPYDSESLGLVTSSSESEDDWPLPQLPDRSGGSVGECHRRSTLQNGVTTDSVIFGC